jgi:hypothetical protein
VRNARWKGIIILLSMVVVQRVVECITQTLIVFLSVVLRHRSLHPNGIQSVQSIMLYARMVIHAKLMAGVDQIKVLNLYKPSIECYVCFGLE